MNIGRTIKEKRKELNLTQEELAKKLFVSRQLISKWENDRSYPDLEQVVLISELFQLSLDSLLKEDAEIVKELNFDSHKKKMFIGLILSLVVILLSGVIVFGVFWRIDSETLEYDDITITKIEKRILPRKQIINQHTGETVTLSEDVEFTIYFKTNKFFVDLAKRSGYKNYFDETDTQVMISAERKFFGGNRESTIVILSDREQDVLNPRTNIGKGLYIYDSKRSKDSFNKGDDDYWPTVAESSRKIASWEELDQLPDSASQKSK